MEQRGSCPHPFSTISGHSSNFTVAFCNSLTYMICRLPHSSDTQPSFSSLDKTAWSSHRLVYPRRTRRHMQSSPHVSTDCAGAWLQSHPHVRTYDNALPCTVTRPQCEAARKKKDPFPSCCTAPGAWQMHLVSVWLLGPKSQCHSIPVSSVNPCPEPHHKGWNISVARRVILQVQLSCSA